MLECEKIAITKLGWLLLAQDNRVLQGLNIFVGQTLETSLIPLF